MKDSNNNNSQDFVRLPYFDWDKAKDFYYVAKLGSFSEAGKFLNISQSSLSRKIRILEDHLNFKVFTRLPHGLELTRKGEELYAIIERTFLELRGIYYKPAVITSNGTKRKIRIATTHALANHVLGDHFLVYNKANPHIILEMIANDFSLDIVLNDVDIAIRPIDKSIKDRDSLGKNGLCCTYLCSLSKKLYASEGYLKKYGEPQTIEELKNHRILAHALPEKHPYADVNWILTLGMPKGQFHEPAFTSNSIELLIEAAKQDMGIYGSYAEYKIIKTSRLVNILSKIKSKEIKEYFIYPEYLKDDKEIISLETYLRECLKKTLI